MQRFIRDGHITVQADFPEAFHQKIYDQARHLYATEGNPGNEVLPRIPALYDILCHPVVDGALHSLLGPTYLVHPHRHGHYTPPGSEGQNHHKDSYEADENVRHHHGRWVMGFYYPQNVDTSRGPSAVLPGTQYFIDQDEAYRQAELPLQGPAGSFTIVHYDLWHRAMPNKSLLPRFMIKFLFCRMAEPVDPTWQSEGREWHSQGGGAIDHIGRVQWNWYHGRSSCDSEAGQSVDTLMDQYQYGHESNRLAAVYQLGMRGESGVAMLMDLLRREAEEETEINLQKTHTNPCQFDAAYGLVVAGKNAIPTLVEALGDSAWEIRASAADTLGDIGMVAADTTPQLISMLTDPSSWVRRNAAEALGIFGTSAEEAVPALSGLLADQNPQVRLNAISALQRIGPAAESATNRLRQSLEDDEYFVRVHAQIALDRIQTTA